MRSHEFINESPELAEKYKAHLIKTLPLLMNFLSKTSKDYLPTEDEMLDVVETGYEVMLQSGDKNKAGEAVRNKLKYLMNKKSVMESLYVDVPNEDWLQDKIDYTKSKGRDKFGAPFFTSTTAYFKQNVRVPIQILRRLPGIEGEQQNVRSKDLMAIKKIMKNTGKLPIHNNKEYVPFVRVAYNGEAWVFNGNHRIMAAAELFDEGDKRFSELPINLSYHDGGERVKSGPLSPEKIGNQNVMEGPENLNYIGNCTDDDVIEHIFGDATGFAQAVDEYGDEFTLDDLVVKYDPETDVHSFYYKKQGVTEGSNAEAYKEKLLATLPLMMRFFEKNGSGWTPSKEQMLVAVETGYTVMKHTGDVKQAGKAMMDELNTLHRMSQGEQGVAEGLGQDYLSQIPNLSWKPVSRNVWNTIQDEGLDEEQDTPSHSDWVMASLSIDPKDAQALMAFENDAIEDFNRFDIHLKSRYPGLTDLIDYDRGTVTIVKPINKQGVAEDWSEKYKKSINCKNPRGFSQRAHCAGRKKRGESK